MGNPAGLEPGNGPRSFGKYEVLAPLQRGGMAELFLACTVGPGGFRKYVAAKRVRADVGLEQVTELFLDEARITAGFSHPNIAQVYDLLQERDGFVLVMEFIAGQNLRQLGRAAQARGPLPVGLVARVMHDAALALHYAHNFTTATGERRAVIHRDVTPKNVMVTYDGVVKLLDFGIAKANESLHHTRAGIVRGTLGYISPEQLRAERLDGRSDLFSLGIIFHELLTGQRLFTGKTPAEVIPKVLSGEIPVPKHPVQSLPSGLVDLVMATVARERERRPATGRDFARALASVFGTELYDPEQVAEAMQGLFGEQIRATRELLQSSTPEEASRIVSSGAMLVSPADFPEPRRAKTPIPLQERIDRTAPLPAPVSGAYSRANALADPPPLGGANPVSWAIGLMFVLLCLAFIGYQYVQKPDDTKNKADLPVRSLQDRDRATMRR